MPINADEMIKKTIAIPAVAEQVFDLISIRCVRIADTSCNGPVLLEAEVSPAKVKDGKVFPSKDPTVLVRVADISTNEGIAVINALRAFIGQEINKQNLL